MPGGSQLALRHASSSEEIMARTARKQKADQKAKWTQDHNTIQEWVEERGERPAVVEDTEILRIDFNGPDGSRNEELQAISWEEYFRVFDDRDFEFLHQDRTDDDKLSRFNKFVKHGSG
jgi:hypothetical protein